MSLPAATPSSEIVVRGYSDRYWRAFDKLRLIEGGLVDDPADRGGATNHGISLRFLVTAGAIDEDLDGFADFDLDMDGDVDRVDIRLLTIGDARYLFHRHFWLPLDAETYPEPIGEMLFDQAVNGGLLAARKLLQRAVNAVLRMGRYRQIPLKVDGIIGVQTRNAFASMFDRHPEELASEYRVAAADRYIEIARRNPSQARFLKGWLRRASELGA